MTLIKTLIVLAVVGVGLWGINVYIPTNPTIKAIVTSALVLILCLWLLQTFGVIDCIRGVRMK